MNWTPRELRSNFVFDYRHIIFETDYAHLLATKARVSVQFSSLTDVVQSCSQRLLALSRSACLAAGLLALNRRRQAVASQHPCTGRWTSVMSIATRYGGFDSGLLRLTVCVDPGHRHPRVVCVPRRVSSVESPLTFGFICQTLFD